MQRILPGDIVKISDSLKEFCQDFDVNLSSADVLNSSSFLVIFVDEEKLEVQALTADGEIMTFGFLDVSKVKNENRTKCR